VTPAALVASRRHTAIFFLIAAVVTVAGMAQKTSASPSPGSSRLPLYAALIGAQLLWLYFVWRGVRKQGHTLAIFTGGRWPSGRVARGDVAYALLAFAAAHAAVAAVEAIGARGPARVGFLLPGGTAESLVWVLLSVTAGFSEEVVFRGYLQRQLTALTGHAGLAIVLQAVVFGVMHGYQGPWSIATTGAYGLVLGVIAWWRGNVRAGALAHAATDIVGGLLR
jgi:uncharacterized protein